MCICKVDTCFRCLDLRTGCYIIAFFFLINGISSLIMLIGLSSMDDETIKAILIETIAGLDINMLLTIVKVMWIISLVMGFVHVAITGTLFYGLNKNKRACLRPFVIFHNIMNTVQVLGLITTMFILFNFIHIYFIILVGLNIYFTIIVNSFYKQMESTTPPPVTCGEDNLHELDNLSSVHVQETNIKSSQNL